MELAMSEWHVTPDYIARNWSEPLLHAMFEARNKRVERANKETKKANRGN